MKVVSRFQPPPENGPQVQFDFEDVMITAPQGVSLAAALLAHSGDPTRITATAGKRTAYCMMGVCFECLVDVDGVPNTQACMTTVRDGMVVKRQVGLRTLKDATDVSR